MVNENENMPRAQRKIQWHPAFCAAEIELYQNRKELEFKKEYNLSQKPLQIDLLIVEKRGNVQIENEIGHIFRKHNIVEYKSPEDGLNIDDFFKTLGYAYLYKGLGKRVNEIPLEELTVSIFRATKPKELMRHLAGYGFNINRYASGIYYVMGLMIPVQIVVTNELEAGKHSSLKMLSNRVQKGDIQRFSELVQNFKESGERENVDAVMQVSISANQDLYKKIRRELDMCEAMRELMKEELQESYQDGRRDVNAQLSKLYDKLIEENRQEDIMRSMKDVEYREKLCKEFGIE